MTKARIMDTNKLDLIIQSFASKENSNVWRKQVPQEVIVAQLTDGKDKNICKSYSEASVCCHNLPEYEYSMVGSATY